MTMAMACSFIAPQLPPEVAPGLCCLSSPNAQLVTGGGKPASSAPCSCRAWCCSKHADVRRKRLRQSLFQTPDGPCLKPLNSGALLSWHGISQSHCLLSDFENQGAGFMVQGRRLQAGEDITVDSWSTPCPHVRII